MQTKTLQMKLTLENRNESFELSKEDMQNQEALVLAILRIGKGGIIENGKGRYRKLQHARGIYETLRDTQHPIKESSVRRCLSDLLNGKYYWFKPEGCKGKAHFEKREGVGRIATDGSIVIGEGNKKRTVTCFKVNEQQTSLKL